MAANSPEKLVDFPESGNDVLGQPGVQTQELWVSTAHCLVTKLGASVMLGPAGDTRGKSPTASPD